MGLKLVSCTSSPILVVSRNLLSTFLYSILEPLWDPKRKLYVHVWSSLSLSSDKSLRVKMGQAKGCWILQRVVPSDKSADSYSVSLLLSPVVSVWDCIVRKMRYTYVPEWV
ncbi:unnamed protein product [Brassica rapa subsp. narinosa]